MASFLAFVRYLRLRFLVSFFRLLARLFASPPKSSPDAVLRIPSRDKGRTIKAHVYRPPEDGPGSRGPCPVLINFFGGGFTLPMHGADDLYCRHVASLTGYVVLDIQYRLAPEHPFPAAINDAEDAAKYVLDHPEKYKASQVSVSGFSSGGTCALVSLSLFPRGTFQSAIAFYPSTNAAGDPSLRVAPVPGGKRLPMYWTRIFRESYMSGMDARDPRISPINAEMSNYPANLLVITAELDTSALEAEELAEKATTEGQATGRNVVLRRMKRVGHGFDKKSDDEAHIQARNESYSLAVDMLKKVASQRESG